MASEVRIRVVAAADDSLRSVFRPLEDAVRNTRARVNQQAKGIGEDTARTVRTRIKDEERAATYIARIRDRERQQEQRANERAEAARVRAAQQATDQIARMQRGAARQIASEFGSRAVSNLQQTANAAARHAKELATGAGYKFDVSDAMSRNFELQRRATELSNQGYNPSRGIARIDPRAIEAQIKAAADATGFDRLSAAEGLNKFVAKNGEELQLGLDMLPNLGKLAKASGADLSDLADAAGDVSQALGDMAPDEKAKRIDAVMRTIAGQGKIGAVEIKDLASQMAKVSTAASQFGGDAERNIAFMGGLTQMARSTGGAASANQAATSVASLVNTLKTPARIKQFEAQGIEVFDKKTGIFNDPEKIILESLSKTQGDPEKFKKMWANVQGARAVDGARTLYANERAKALKGGASDEAANIAGLKKVADEFKRFRDITIGGKELEESFAARMGNRDSKAQQFNNRFDDVITRMSERVVPALEKMEPAALRVVEGFAAVTSWAAENPGKAITAAIVLSIGKAGLETALKAAIEAGLTRAIGGGPAGGGKGGGGTPAAGGGALGAGLAIAGASFVITSAGITIMDAVFDDKAKDDSAAQQRLGDVGNLLSAAGAQSTLTTKEKLAAAQEARRKAQAIVDSAAEAEARPYTTNAAFGVAGGFFQEHLLSAAMSSLTAGSYGTSYDKQSQDTANAKVVEQARADVAAADAKIDALTAKLSSALGGTLNVNVTNMPTTGFGVDPKGSTTGPD